MGCMENQLLVTDDTGLHQSTVRKIAGR